MVEKKCRLLIILGFCFFNYSLSVAQPGNKRIQYPTGLKNAYFGFNLGYIQYPFSFAQFFFEYTVAGPTFISRTIIDNEETGRHFTFYDAMGIGVFPGRKKQLNAGIRIAHFSNGNIFSRNNGVMVPLSFSVGYAFQ